MIHLKERDLSILVDAQIDKYGDAADGIARERGRQLLELGDDFAADLWEAVANGVNRKSQSN